MSKNLFRFVWVILSLAILLGSLASLASYYSIIQLSITSIYLPLFFFFVFSVTLHFFLLKSTEGRPQRFVTTFMGVQALKMFVHLMVMTIVGFIFPIIAVQFILVYACYYLSFTLVETISLMRIF